ncbi:hypothetical protein [Halomontanus rarus]|uniref:hypothetical protein n=1 Tax=Halomontanus rarus TaxID=3034020 RepID=UPI0023E85790|nr:hypothetical protein [Halovivax sp. TS33]
MTDANDPHVDQPVELAEPTLEDASAAMAPLHGRGARVGDRDQSPIAMNSIVYPKGSET